MKETYYILDKATGGMKQVSEQAFNRQLLIGKWVFLTSDFYK